LEADKVNIDTVLEEDQKKKCYKALMVSSGAANTALIEDEHFSFVHGGRQSEAFELGGNSTFIVCIGSISSLKKIHPADWSTCIWHGNTFGRMIPLTFEHGLGWHEAVNLHPVIALTHTKVDEPNIVENVSETVSSFSEIGFESELEVSPWRGTYCLPHTGKILFSQDMEFKTSDLPRWKPRVIIDRHTP
jgi:hypothetical protein